MRIVTTTDTWSMECGDDEYYHKGETYKLRLLFEAQEMNILDDSDNLELSLKYISNTNIKISGKVIFKDEYLLIIENRIRFGVVLNNQFRFGNHNYIGNKEIDHSKIQIGNVIEVSGYFRFQRIFFCVFTYLPNEFSIPNIDYEWKVKDMYRITNESWDSKDLLELEKVNGIDSSSQSIDDTYALEFELLNDSPLPFDDTSGTHGFVSTICWIDESNWVKNCDGRINNGIKRGKWVYLDKRGENKKEFHYAEK
ncbi:hypothetical protein [Aquimarina sp. LLG6339-5]|uniref:hypothetical protein n=1 Tax=Aquimarina sp. LLG6339-5 TaxID=3160830 RepID=UPI00386E7795